MAKKAGLQALIGEISLVSTNIREVLAKITRRIRVGEKTFVVTPNSEFIVYAQRHPWFKEILNQADFALPDGMGLVWASRFLAFRPLVTFFLLMRNLPPRYTRSCLPDSLKKVTSRPLVIKERISGTDLMERLCQEAAKRNWSVYLLGGQPEVAKKALAVLQKHYPGLKGWAESGPKFKMVARSDDRRTLRPWVEKINQKKPDLLFVALGMGKQEKFIWENWKTLNVKLAMGVGGAFDYLSGQIPRAPKWLQKAGFEWFYRLFRQPWRWRRQLALLKFVWLILKEKIMPQTK